MSGSCESLDGGNFPPLLRKNPISQSCYFWIAALDHNNLLLPEEIYESVVSVLTVCRGRA